MLRDWWFTGLGGSTATPIEIVWIMIATVGLCISSINFHRSMKALAYLDVLNQNGLLRLVGKTLVVEESLRLLIQAIFVSIGIIAVFFNPGELGGKIISWFIVLSILIIVLKSFISMRARNKVINYEDVRKEGRDEQP